MKTFGLLHGLALFAVASCAVVDVKRLRSAKTSSRKSAVQEVLAARIHNQAAFSKIASQGEECGHTRQITATSERGKNCPATCPLYVKDTKDDKFCSFRCVQANIKTCQSWNPQTPVPDTELGVCRECAVSGCHTCAMDGTDTCLECKKGQWLTSDGQCSNWRQYIWFGVFALIALIAVFIGIWAWSLTKRAKIVDNQLGFERGIHSRSASKLRQPVDPDNPDAPREFWPLNTNLLTTPAVGGNAIVHLFNFQMLLIVWAAIVVFGWVIMALAYDTDFLRLGTREPGKTPRDNCIIVAWGFTTQERLMFAKYMFVAILYLVSFIGAIAYAIRQMRVHHRLDEERISHKDFAAKITGLPVLKGSSGAEEELRKHVEAKVGQKVLGVSICWDMCGKEEMLMKVIDNDYEERIGSELTARRKDLQEIQIQEEKEYNFVDRRLASWENFLLSPTITRLVKKQRGSGAALSRSAVKRQARTNEATEEGEDEVNVEIDVVAELESIISTDKAFAIFETEAARDAAVDKAAEMGGIDFQECKLQMEEAKCEPQAMNWEHLKSRSWTQTLLRISVGILVIFGALALWCLVYYPYARSVAKADYAHGKDPDWLSKTMFGLIVIAGNAFMYFVSAEVADRIQFETTAKREVCYMLLYTFACVFNVLLDLVMAYKEVYLRMVGMGVQTHDGVPLAEVDSFVGRFDTYAMQKSLGQVLFDYSFPSTFLIPFLVEPFVVIIVPYQLMSLIIQSNSSIVGSAAEAYIASTPMDLSRYADVILNLMLAVLMFFFPGGFIHKLFLGFIIAHIWIYSYDHYRVLRSIPACDFATMTVDWWAQWMLSIPCGLLLACAYFKANCQEDFPHCWEDHRLIYHCFALLFAHIIVHTLILLYVVPHFNIVTKPQEVPYQVCSKQMPCSWFNANPVNCLRSKYIYEHNPPCDYFILGKDHFLRENDDLHLYYTANTPRLEEYNAKKLVYEHGEAIRHHLSAKFHAVEKRFGRGEDAGSAAESAQGVQSAESAQGDQGSEMPGDELTPQIRRSSLSRSMKSQKSNDAGSK